MTRVALFFVFLLSYQVLALDSPFVNSDEFQRVLFKNENVLALFTRTGALSCPECDVAADTFESFDYDGDLVAVTVDCDEQTSLCVQYELNHLPSVLLFNADFGVYEYKKAYVYEEALQEFVNKHIAPKTTLVQSQVELDELKEENKILLVGFFDPVKDEKVRGSFRRTAGQLFTEYKFAEVLVTDLDDELLLQNDATFGTIQMVKKVGDQLITEVFDQETVSRKRIISWIDANVPWVVREIESGALYSDLKDSFRQLPVLTVYLDYDNEDVKNDVIVALENTADSFRNRIAFTYMNGNSDEFLNAFERWGYVDRKLPIMMLSNPYSHEAFTFEGHDLHQNSIGSFCDDFLGHRLKPHIIKQQVPTQSEEESVKIVVHDTWRSIVHDPSSDVVVFFYLPEDQCQHCIKFLKEYEKVAAELKNQHDVVLTKVDMDANVKLPGVHVSNFPTIQLYPMANKFQEVKYSGPRTQEALKGWILNNLSLREEDRRVNDMY